MPARFGDIRFNLMRAIEMFEDLNHEDMDVAAPPSSHDHYKEKEIAHRLNDFLGQLIEEGVFDECQLRNSSSESAEDAENEEEEEEDQEGQEEEEAGYESDRSTPSTEGFGYPSGSPSDVSDPYASSGSRGSFSDRFKRYIRRIIPGGRGSRSRSASRSRSRSQSQ